MVTGIWILLFFCLVQAYALVECLALTWDDVDFDNATININKTLLYRKVKEGGKIAYTDTPKSQSSNRVLPLIPQMVEILKERKNNNLHDGIVFQNSKGGYVKTMNGKYFTVRNGPIGRIQEITGIKGVHPHALRHTFATRGLENGIPLKVMQELLGHSSIKMTADLYTHVLPETKEKEMGKLSHLF